MQFKSERLVYRHFKETDFENFQQLTGNAQVMEMITGQPLNEEESFKRFLSHLETNKHEQVLGWYAVSLKDSLAFVGLGKLVMTEVAQAEIGYSLLPAYWGKGYASEISETLIRQARKLPAISSLIAIIDPQNIASKKILQKGNFNLLLVCDIDGLPAEIYQLDL